MTLDLRSRYDDEVQAEHFDVADFFENELPALAEERAHLAVPGALELGVAPFTVESEAGTWTLDVTGDAVRIVEGDRGVAAVQLDADEVHDIAYDLRTPMTLLAAGTLDLRRGDLGDFLDWWVVLRSLLDGRAVHTAGSVGFSGPDGSDLDLHRSFAPDDDPAEMAHFLTEAGYLHLTGVFEDEEMARVTQDMDAAFARYAPDDGRSWWATTAGGERRPVRLQWFHEQSPATAALLEDDRLVRIGRLVDDGYGLETRGNAIEALVKPIGVVEGISDLPWHKDCSLGRHSYRCCSLTVGISVTGADARSGQLGVVAGSHRTLVQPAFFRHSWGLPEVALPTRAGDVTVHCSCTLHMSQPPVERERRVLYTGFTLPPRDRDTGSSRSAAEIARVREQAYKTVNQSPGYGTESVPRRGVVAAPAGHRLGHKTEGR